MGSFAFAELFFFSFNHDRHAWFFKLESDCHILKFYFPDVDTYYVNEHSPGFSLQTGLQGHALEKAYGNCIHYGQENGAALSLYCLNNYNSLQLICI